MSPAVQSIEQKRLALKVSRSELERAAQLSDRYYAKILAGKHMPRAAVLARLNSALDNIRKRRKAGNDRDFALTVSYRLALIVAATALGHDPTNAQRQDPSRRATQCADWMAAVPVRRLAIYLLTSECGFSQSDVARAGGMTKQSVSDVCAELEDSRDEGSAFERLADTLRDWIMGEME